MDQFLPPDDDPRRLAVREWLASNPDPSPRQLAESGYVAPHWPEPWGLGADPITQIVIDDEFARAGVKRPSNQIGIGWAAPTIIHAGSEAQKQRYVLPALAGEEVWCQLFSEPGAGSDLGSLTTRAERDGDRWIVNGQKVWCSGGRASNWGILMARTDMSAPKHEGISFFLCPMDAPGIEVRPLRQMTGEAEFDEVFFTDAQIPADSLIGEVNDGWRLAKVTLGNERVSLSTGGALWGQGPTASDLIDECRGRGGLDDVMRHRLARLYCEEKVLDIIRLRTISARLRGEQPGPEASIRKLMADEHGQRVMEAARDVLGAEAMLTGERGGTKTLASRSWYSGYMFSRALTIGGGTTEVQKNILGEKVLGLPAEPDPTRGAPWSQASGPHRAQNLESPAKETR